MSWFQNGDGEEEEQHEQRVQHRDLEQVLALEALHRVVETLLEAAAEGGAARGRQAGAVGGGRSHCETPEALW